MTNSEEIRTEIEGFKYVFDKDVFCHSCGKKGIWRSEDPKLVKNQDKFACMSCNNVYYITINKIAEDIPRNVVIAMGLRNAEENAEMNGSLGRFDEVKKEIEIPINTPIGALEV